MRLLGGRARARERAPGHRATASTCASPARSRFAGGVLGVFDCGLDMVDASRLEVVGDAGSLFLADPWHSRAARIEVRRPGGTEVHRACRPPIPYACELEDLAAAVRGERPHPFGRDDAVAQARTIDALYRSARVRRRRGALTLRYRRRARPWTADLRPLGIGEILDAGIKLFTAPLAHARAERRRPDPAGADPLRARHGVGRARAVRLHDERDRRGGGRGGGVPRRPGHRSLLLSLVSVAARHGGLLQGGRRRLPRAPSRTGAARCASPCGGSAGCSAWRSSAAPRRARARSR